MVQEVHYLQVNLFQKQLIDHIFILPVREQDYLFVEFVLRPDHDIPPSEP